MKKLLYSARVQAPDLEEDSAALYEAPVLNPDQGRTEADVVVDDASTTIYLFILYPLPLRISLDQLLNHVLHMPTTYLLPLLLIMIRIYAQH